MRVRMPSQGGIKARWHEKGPDRFAGQGLLLRVGVAGFEPTTSSCRTTTPGSLIELIALQALCSSDRQVLRRQRVDRSPDMSFWEGLFLPAELAYDGQLGFQLPDSSPRRAQLCRFARR